MAGGPGPWHSPESLQLLRHNSYVQGLRLGGLRAGGAGALKDSTETHSVSAQPSEDYASACSFGCSPCHCGQGQSY